MKKGELNMLQFLQTGKVLYVLAAFCVLGTISKLVTSSLYKRLIEETDNMALTKNKNLRALKQKTENVFLVNRSVRNPGAYIEKQLYGFRFMKISLNSWDHLAVQAMILSFMIGGIAAFGAYWYRCDSNYIVLYGTMGILSGLFMVFVDNITNVSGKRQHLADCLIDYVENSPHFYRNVDKFQDDADSNKKGMAGISENEHRESKVRGERKTENLAVLARKKESKVPAVRQLKENKPRREENADELEKSIGYLKQSLEQIAAGREQDKGETQAGRPSPKTTAEPIKKELSPEQMKLLSEILTEYLA